MLLRLPQNLLIDILNLDYFYDSIAAANSTASIYSKTIKASDMKIPRLYCF
jgi:hypothetical protein